MFGIVYPAGPIPGNPIHMGKTKVLGRPSGFDRSLAELRSPLQGQRTKAIAQSAAWCTRRACLPGTAQRGIRSHQRVEGGRQGLFRLSFLSLRHREAGEAISFLRCRSPRRCAPRKDKILFPFQLDACANHLYNNIKLISRSGARTPGWEGSKAKPVTRMGSPALSRNCKEITLQARTPARNGIITALADRRWSMPEKT